MSPIDQRSANAPRHAIFARGDTRNLLRVALAMSQAESPTLNNLAKATGHVKSGILRDIERLQGQLGIAWLRSVDLSMCLSIGARYLKAPME